MKNRAVAAALVVLSAVLAIAPTPAIAATSPAKAEVPKVIGLRLDKAVEKLEKAGFKKTKFEDRKEARGVVKRSNWVVADQSPSAGTSRSKSSTIRLGVLKKGEKPKAAVTAAPVPKTPPLRDGTCATWRHADALPKLYEATVMLGAMRKADKLPPKPDLALNFSAGLTNVCTAIPDTDGSKISDLAVLLYVTDKGEEVPQGFQR